MIGFLFSTHGCINLLALGSLANLVYRTLKLNDTALLTLSSTDDLGDVGSPVFTNCVVEPSRYGTDQKTNRD